MNRVSREERTARSKRTAKMFAIIAVSGVLSLVFVLWTQRGEDLDDQLCPKKGGPTREVIVLVDTSDPLSDKHRAELRRLLREMINPAASGRHTSLAVKKGERVTLYQLESSGIPAKPVVQLCHPGGSPEDNGRLEGLTRGTVIKQWHWQHFVRVIETMFPDEERAAQPISPILETIAVITARHASSRRAEKGGKPTHLIVISDLLQNTEILSHYRQYPKPGEISRELRTDLSRVEVSLFRLERHKYEQFQTPAHFYWWTDWIENMEGKVVWQQPL